MLLRGYFVVVLGFGSGLVCSAAAGLCHLSLAGPAEVSADALVSVEAALSASAAVSDAAPSAGVSVLSLVSALFSVLPASVVVSAVVLSSAVVSLLVSVVVSAEVSSFVSVLLRRLRRVRTGILASASIHGSHGKCQHAGCSQYFHFLHFHNWYSSFS